MVAAEHDQPGMEEGAKDRCVSGAGVEIADKGTTFRWKSDWQAGTTSGLASPTKRTLTHGVDCT